MRWVFFFFFQPKSRQILSLTITSITDKATVTVQPLNQIDPSLEAQVWAVLEKKWIQQ
jgi:hypothetical protein